MQYTVAESLVIRHFQAVPGQRFYVWLGVGLVNWVFDEVYGHYLEIQEGAAKLWLHPFRLTIDEPRFRRNPPDQIHGLLVNMLTASYREETGENPGSALTTNLTDKAKAVRADYLRVFPPPEEDR